MNFARLSRLVTACLTGLGLLVLSGVAFAAHDPLCAKCNTVSATAVGGTVIKPITLDDTNTLRFGVIVPTGTDGTVSVDPQTGDRDSTDVHLLPATGDIITDAGAANFTVTGEAGRQYSVDVPTNTSLTNPANDSMGLSLYTHFPPEEDGAGNLIPVPAGAVGVGVIAGTGFDQFNIGATLSVGAAQPPGLYQGTFSVTVRYQ